MADIPVDFPVLVQRCAPNVDAGTLQSLIGVESANKPHAIGYKVVAKDGSVLSLKAQPKNVEQAKAWATWLLANGYRFDAGIAQVNTVNFKRTSLTVETMFDACINIRAGASVLSECYARALLRFPSEQFALRAALSCYQSGNFVTGFKTGYVQKVVTSYLPRLRPNLGSGGVSAPSLKGTTTMVAPASVLHVVSSEVPGWSAVPNAVNE